MAENAVARSEYLSGKLVTKNVPSQNARRDLLIQEIDVSKSEYLNSIAAYVLSRCGMHRQMAMTLAKENAVFGSGHLSGKPIANLDDRIW